MANNFLFIIIFSTIKIQFKWAIIYLKAGIPNDMDPLFQMWEIGTFCTLIFNLSQILHLNDSKHLYLKGKFESQYIIFAKNLHAMYYTNA